MNAHYSVELPSATFAIGEDEITKLVGLLSDRVGTVVIEANCSDSTERRFSGSKELLAYENPKRKALQRLRLSAHSDDFAKRASIDFSASLWRGLSIDISAREDVMVRLRDEVRDLIAGARPWYAWLHRVNFVTVGFVAFGLILLYVGLLVRGSSSALVTGLAHLGAWGAFLVVGVGLGLNRLRDFAFPRAVFLIGQGTRRFEHLKLLHWSLLIPLVTGILLTVLL